MAGLNCYFAENRSSRLQMFYKTSVLKHFPKFTGKHLCWSILFIKNRIKILLEADSNTGLSSKFYEISWNLSYRTPPYECLCKKKGNEVCKTVSFCCFAIFRSSLPEVFCRKSGLRNFANFTGKHLYRSVFFNKVVVLRCSTEHLRWLLLYII